MQIREFQKHIENLYFARDNARGLGGTFLWFMEEVGELATALREGDDGELAGEFADVLAWLVTLASMKGVDLQQAAADKYAQGCPACRQTPCRCAAKA